jgi:hypothetical protein
VLFFHFIDVMANSNNIEKYQALKEVWQNDHQGKNQETLKKYNPGENRGVMNKDIQSVKSLIKNVTPQGVFSLMRGVNIFSDWMYGLALLAAIFKDALDIINATGIGYFIVVLATFLVSIFIAMMMLLGSFSGRTQQKMIRSWLVLLGGTMTELFMGVNFLPIETITVLVVYFLMLSERKRDKEEKRREAVHWEETQENYV